MKWYAWCTKICIHHEGLYSFTSGFSFIQFQFYFEDHFQLFRIIDRITNILGFYVNFLERLTIGIFPGFCEGEF